MVYGGWVKSLNLSRHVEWHVMYVPILSTMQHMLFQAIRTAQISISMERGAWSMDYTGFAVRHCFSSGCPNGRGFKVPVVATLADCFAGGRPCGSGFCG